VGMARVSLCGLVREKDATLEGLQSLGVLHLVPLAEPRPLQPIDPAQRRRAETAFRHLAETPEHRRPYRPDAPFDVERVVAAVLANRTLLRELADRRDELAARAAGLAPWGEFTFPPVDELGGYRLWLYPLPIKERPALARVALPWALVGHGPTTLYVAVVAKEEPPPDLLPVARIRAGIGPLSRLRAELEDTVIAIEEAETERTGLTRWRLLLGAHLAAAEDTDDRRAAAEQTRDEAGVFAVQGWAPVDALPSLGTFGERHRLALLVEPPAPDDMPPTLLRPDDRIAAGADLTAFYSSPGYRSWDPSLVVFTSFALFFAMIVADAGYALVMAGGLALYRRTLGATAPRRRFRAIGAALAGTTFVYGIAAGSWFGLAPPPGSALDRVAFIDVTDFETMMRVSVAIGALHLTVAHLMVAWLNRGTGRAVSALGWTLAIWSGLTLWLAGAPALTTLAGLGLALGLAAVFWGAATARPVARPRDWVMRLADGAMALTGATRLFGDLLSYLRLFALGLASASLASTFNVLAADLRGDAPGIGLLLSILVLAFGHAVNFLLGIMSGVVHGLRLNFIEFFGWGLTEEGYPFRAFKRRETPA
jgi:V/A-type H+-transporting ATPase subunit I